LFPKFEKRTKKGSKAKMNPNKVITLGARFSGKYLTILIATGL
jgi:hypothetical protein